MNTVKANLTMFDEPIIKKAAEMEAGDIYTTEYGDYGNNVTVVFEKCEAENSCIRTDYHRINETESRQMYGFGKIENAIYKVVGKELKVVGRE